MKIVGNLAGLVALRDRYPMEEAVVRYSEEGFSSDIAEWDLPEFPEKVAMMSLEEAKETLIDCAKRSSIEGSEGENNRWYLFVRVAAHMNDLPKAMQWLRENCGNLFVPGDDPGEPWLGKNRC